LDSNQHTTIGFQPSPWREGATRTTRLYSSKKDGEGFLAKIGKKIFGSKEEKAELARKKEAKNQVSGALDTMLKDAPLGVRMMGKMVAPIISSVASGLSDAMAEQQRTTEEVMEDARGYLMGDPAVSGLLGEPIQMGAPFSQSSSTSSINGQTTTRIQLALPVTGSRTSGTVQIMATQNGIAQMQVDAGGRRLDVNLTKSAGSGSSTVFGGSSSSSSRFNKNDDNIIEAEIIDKDDSKY
jgi:carbon monoxide dehydrogenase subunit G